MTDTEGTEREILVAVVTGNHPYDVLGFQRMLRSLEGIDPYVQSIDDLIMDAGNVRVLYDAVLFYHFVPGPPGAGDVALAERTQEALEELGDTGQGLVVLHHALLAYPGWDPWTEVTGIADRSFTYHPDQTLRVDVADGDHPITAGLASWEVTDETYIMEAPDADSHLLLTTTHPQSMAALAWTRAYHDARTFCCALGHDNKVYNDPGFRTIIQRGIHWAAGRL